MADGLLGFVGGDRSCRQRRVDGGTVAIAKLAISTRYRNGTHAAGYGGVHAFDLAHARFELCVVCRPAASGSLSGGGAAGGSVVVIHSALVPATLRGDVGTGSGICGVPDRGAHRTRTIRTISLFEAVGARNCGACPT